MNVVNKHKEKKKDKKRHKQLVEQVCGTKEEVEARKRYIEEFKYKYSYVKYALTLLNMDYGKIVRNYARVLRVFTYLYDNLFQLVLFKMEEMATATTNSLSSSSSTLSMENISRNDITRVTNNLKKGLLIESEEENVSFVHPYIISPLLQLFTRMVIQCRGNINEMEIMMRDKEKEYKKTLIPDAYKRYYYTDKGSSVPYTLSVFIEFEESIFAENLELRVSSSSSSSSSSSFSSLETKARLSLANYNILREYYIFSIFLWCRLDVVSSGQNGLAFTGVKSREIYTERERFLMEYAPYIHYDRYTIAHALEKVNETRKSILMIDLMTDLKYGAHGGFVNVVEYKEKKADNDDDDEDEDNSWKYNHSNRNSMSFFEFIKKYVREDKLDQFLLASEPVKDTFCVLGMKEGGGGNGKSYNTQSSLLMLQKAAGFESHLYCYMCKEATANNTSIDIYEEEIAPFRQFCSEICQQNWHDCNKDT